MSPEGKPALRVRPDGEGDTRQQPRLAARVRFALDQMRPASRWTNVNPSMSKYRQKDEDGDRYWDPSILTLIVIGIAVLILFNSTSPEQALQLRRFF
jgi:hypothetical protein